MKIAARASLPFGGLIDAIQCRKQGCQSGKSDTGEVRTAANHWYNVDGTHLVERLQEAVLFLLAANVCGSRHKKQVAPDELASTLEPLDEGELDNFALLGANPLGLIILRLPTPPAALLGAAF